MINLQYTNKNKENHQNQTQHHLHLREALVLKSCETLETFPEDW